MSYRITTSFTPTIVFFDGRYLSPTKREKLARLSAIEMSSSQEDFNRYQQWQAHAYIAQALLEWRRLKIELARGKEYTKELGHKIGQLQTRQLSIITRIKVEPESPEPQTDPSEALLAAPPVVDPSSVDLFVSEMLEYTQAYDEAAANLLRLYQRRYELEDKIEKVTGKSCKSWFCDTGFIKFCKHFLGFTYCNFRFLNVANDDQLVQPDYSKVSYDFSQMLLPSMIRKVYDIEGYVQGYLDCPNGTELLDCAPCFLGTQFDLILSTLNTELIRLFSEGAVAKARGIFFRIGLKIKGIHNDAVAAYQENPEKKDAIIQELEERTKTVLNDRLSILDHRRGLGLFSRYKYEGQSVSRTLFNMLHTLKQERAAGLNTDNKRRSSVLLAALPSRAS